MIDPGSAHQRTFRKPSFYRDHEDVLRTGGHLGFMLGWMAAHSTKKRSYAVRHRRRIAVFFTLAWSLGMYTSAEAGQASVFQIGAATSGLVRRILVKDGDQVAPGQLLLDLDCRVLEAEYKARQADFVAAKAVAQRTRNGPRPDEVAIGVAAVGVAQARAEEAAAAYQRETALREGVTTLALVLQTRRDARISAAQLEDARKKLDLLHAGSRAEDIAEADARRDAAVARVEEAQALLEQCSVHAPVAGSVKVLATVGQFVSTAVPVTLVQIESTP